MNAVCVANESSSKRMGVAAGAGALALLSVLSSLLVFAFAFRQAQLLDLEPDDRLTHSLSEGLAEAGSNASWVLVSQAVAAVLGAVMFFVSTRRSALMILAASPIASLAVMTSAAFAWVMSRDAAAALANETASNRMVILAGSLSEMLTIGLLGHVATGCVLMAAAAAAVTLAARDVRPRALLAVAGAFTAVAALHGTWAWRLSHFSAELTWLIHSSPSERLALTAQLSTHIDRFGFSFVVLSAACAGSLTMAVWLSKASKKTAARWCVVGLAGLLFAIVSIAASHWLARSSVEQLGEALKAQPSFVE